MNEYQGEDLESPSVREMTDLESPSSVGEMADMLKRRSIPDIGCGRCLHFLELLRNKRGNSLQNALQVAEAEIRLASGRESEAVQAVGVILRSEVTESKNVRTLAEKYALDGKHTCRLQVLILYQWANEVYQTESHSTKEKLKWIRSLVTDIRLKAYELAGEPHDSSKSAAISYGAIVAEKLLHMLQNMTDVNEDKKKKIEAECNYRIGDMYFRSGEYLTALNYLKTAVYMSRGINHRDEQECELHFILLWTLGNCHYRRREFIKAEKSYDEAIELIQPFPNIAERWLIIVNEDRDKAMEKLDKEYVNFATRLNSQKKPENKDQLLDRIRENQNSATLESALIATEHKIRYYGVNPESSFQRVKDMALREQLKTSDELRVRAQKYHIRYADQRLPALMLHGISFEMALEEDRIVDDVAEWVKETALDVFLISYELAAENRSSSRTIAMNYGAAIMQHLMYWLQSFDADDSILLQIAKADCFFYLANIYFRGRRYQDSSVHFESAVQIFDELNHKKNEHYCLSLWNIANCHYRLREFRLAKDWYVKAVSSIQTALPEVTERWLKIVTIDLGKAQREINRLRRRDVS